MQEIGRQCTGSIQKHLHGIQKSIQEITPGSIQVVFNQYAGSFSGYMSGLSEQYSDSIQAVFREFWAVFR